MHAMFARQRGERQPGQRVGRSLPGFIGSDLGGGLFAAKVDDGFETYVQISRLEMVQAGSEGTIESSAASGRSGLVAITDQFEATTDRSKSPPLPNVSRCESP